MQKTILMTMSRGGTARNILQTDCYRLLKQSGNRIVILTPAYKDERFLNEFSAPGVYFENLVEPKWTFLDRILVGLHMALIYNHSIELWDKHGIFSGEEGSRPRYIIKKIIFSPLSKIRFLRDVVKWLDKILIKDKYFQEVFDKYKPDLVFSTSVMEDTDTYVLKQAQARKIPTVGMVKTWDNTSKMGFRVKTGRLIVWSDYIREESLKFQNYKKEDIIVCGIPQFDFYVEDGFKMEREDFFNLIGADPDKKLIVFGSEGKISSGDGDIAEILLDAIKNKKIEGDCQLFIRPHFMYKDDEKKFEHLKGRNNFILDGGYDSSEAFRDRWDYSHNQIKKFTNLMRYADIVVTSASTLILDAAAFDKPIINIAFDGYHKKPMRKSMLKWYFTEYLRAVLRQDGAPMVRGIDELIEFINNYLRNPKLKSEGREKLRNYFCYKIDGKSGERIAGAILDYLN